ncbi:MAG: type VI secretion system tip protein TssI/VgrG [Candidatus Competibacteraceae bacterium]
MPLTQTTREIAVTSPLGTEVLVFRRMTATEQLGRLSEFNLELLSENAQIKIEDILGKSMTVRLQLPNNQTRYFNGAVTRFCQTENFGRYASYQATLHPWLWFLTRTADCRIFQNKTVPDIIKSIFRDYGFTDFKEALYESYPPRDYCVQYRETNFNFVSRLMEQEGIYYYFQHEADKHIMVLADAYSAHDRFPAYERISYVPPHATTLRQYEHIFDWQIAKAVQPGRYSLKDFDFEKPSTNLETKSFHQQPHAQADFEIYDYPGHYVTKDRGDTYSTLRMAALAAQYEHVEGQGNARGLAVGRLFTLTEYPREDQNREYLISAATYELRSDEFETIPAPQSPPIYSCRFTAIDSKTLYRPPSLTPKPIVQGPQTAIVVGKAGEEIWTDPYGRVKVQFHWDREGQRNENSSCWVRVSHPWAGKNWGSVSIPRLGQEVIVDFLEGDPDQPIITGRVYNAEQMPPYGLPAGAVTSGVKSNSTKGGGGYNEISMDDTKGKEQITVHAQYDMGTTVEHDDSQTVHNNRTITVDGTHTETIKKDTTITISEGNLDHKVVKGKADYYVLQAMTETFDATQHTTVKQNITVESLQGEILIEAANKITLHTGDSRIELYKDGRIDILGKNIFIHGSVDAKMDAPKAEITAGDEAKIGCGHQNSTFNRQRTEHSGAAINSSAVGMHEITGAIIKIN